jgi:hypothetical protein
MIYAAREATWEMEAHDAAKAGGDPASAGDPSSGPSDPAPSFQRTQGCQNVFSRDDVRNIRVNQDCSLRRQAEEAIAINPTAPHNLIVGYNDNRIGFNHGAYAWSFDRGRSRGDQVPPFWQLLLGDGHTADAFSDPTATFDANGNAYIGSILFDINSAANALAVMKSNAGIGGASYHTPSPVAFQTYRTSPVGVVASDNNPNIAHDKEFIVADASLISPKRNNVYMTWTRFTTTGVGVGGDSPIYFSQSTNGGTTCSMANRGQGHAIRTRALIRLLGRTERSTCRSTTAILRRSSTISCWSSALPAPTAVSRPVGRLPSRSPTMWRRSPLVRTRCLAVLQDASACHPMAIA